MKTFAKVLVEKTNGGFTLIEIILCGSSVYWRYGGESTVYLYKHECEYAKHQDPLLLVRLMESAHFNWKLISYEIL